MVLQNSQLRLASVDKQRWIVAMKGASFTRKAELASLIAASFTYPLLSLEDVLHALRPDKVQISSSESIAPQDLAFRIICNMAESHLWSGISDKVVIHSPLSSRSHTDQLIELASSMPNTRVLIVECKPENTYLWQMKVEQHFQRKPNRISQWYRANSWDDVLKESIQHSHDDSKAFKLILDPLTDYLHYRGRDFKPPPFMDALKYMMRHEKGDEPEVVVYRQWQFNANVAGKSSYTYCRDGHTITRYTEGSGHEYQKVKCMACGKRIKSCGVYTCSNCVLALHKECAESFDKSNTWKYPLRHGISLEKSKYRFSQVLDCASCHESGKAFSAECGSCLFETNLKSRQLPTVINHRCDPHFLSVMLLPMNKGHQVHMCSACGHSVEFISYSCKTCCTFYHFNCLHEIPIKLKHKHGGHHHRLQLKFNDCDKAEDYVCDECLELRDPETWFYSCKDCHFYLHLNCVISKTTKGGSWSWQYSAEENGGHSLICEDSSDSSVEPLDNCEVRWANGLVEKL